MTQVKNHLRLRTKIKHLLIAGGLEGVDQKTIIQKCRTYNSTKNPNGFKGEDVREVLQILKERNLVQLFSVSRGYSKKPTRVWRATQELKNAKL